jgi:hypothetical protein
MVDGGVRFGHLPQRLALMPFLPAGGLAGRFAQAARLAPELLQPVAGRRLTAVGAVQPQSAFQFGNPRLHRCVFRAKTRHFRHHRCRGGSRLRSIFSTGGVLR